MTNVALNQQVCLQVRGIPLPDPNCSLQLNSFYSSTVSAQAMMSRCRKNLVFND